jgi:hypothetical protein
MHQMAGLNVLILGQWEDSFRPCSHVATMPPCAKGNLENQRKLDHQRRAALTPDSLPMTMKIWMVEG